MSTATLTEEKTLVGYEAKDGVAYLTLDDPPVNGYTHEMMREIDEGILKARFDNDVHVIVLTGAGEKFFCAGANINMLQNAEPRFKYQFCLHANETLNRLEHTPKLVIAALNGHTVGGGLEIAMAADLRIARRQGGKDCGKVGLPEITLGVLPGTGGTQRLSRMLGKSRAIELMVTGGLLNLDQAKDHGLINDIFDADDIDGWRAQIHEYAQQFCPPNTASKAAGRIKRAVQSGCEVPFESGLAIERELQQQLFESADATEGLNAYIEKRKPSFSGK